MVHAYCLQSTLLIWIRIGKKQQSICDTQHSNKTHNRGMWKIYYTTYELEFATQNVRSTQRKLNYYNNKIANGNKNYKCTMKNCI